MSLYGALAENTRRGERVENASVTFTGSVTINVPAPMRQITRALATLEGNAAPGLGPSVITSKIAAGGSSVTFFAWQPTGATNPTLVAGTSACTIDYALFGTL